MARVRPGGPPPAVTVAGPGQRARVCKAACGGLGSHAFTARRGLSVTTVTRDSDRGYTTQPERASAGGEIFKLSLRVSAGAGPGIHSVPVRFMAPARGPLRALALESPVPLALRLARRAGPGPGLSAGDRESGGCKVG